MHAIQITRHGGPEVMAQATLACPQPKAGEIVFRVEAAGVNFIDIYQRSGLYPIPLPAVLGNEAAGIITAVAPGVQRFKIGDRVVSAKATGSYAEYAAAPADHCVRVPDAVESKIAAAVFLQGATAHYLACDTFPLKPGDTAWCMRRREASACF